MFVTELLITAHQRCIPSSVQVYVSVESPRCNQVNSTDSLEEAKAKPKRSHRHVGPAGDEFDDFDDIGLDRGGFSDSDDETSDSDGLCN